MVKTCGLTLVIHSFEGMFSFTLIFFKNFISISFYVTLAYSKKNLRLDGQCRGKRVLLLTQVWSSKHRITLSYILDSLCCFVFWNFKSSLINIFHLTVLKRPRWVLKLLVCFQEVCYISNRFYYLPPGFQQSEYVRWETISQKTLQPPVEVELCSLDVLWRDVASGWQYG